MPDQATLDFYEREAPNYTATSTQGQSRHLDNFLSRLNPGAYILELGCGGGRDASHMIEHGFVVDATDGTQAMTRKARERFNVPARVMRFDELEAIDRYDAIWAHASLLHAARAELPRFLQGIYQALHPQGLHFANYKLGDGEGRDKLGRLTNLPTATWLEETYSAANFEILETDRYAGKGCDGTQRDWLALTVKRND